MQHLFLVQGPQSSFGFSFLIKIIVYNSKSLIKIMLIKLKSIHKQVLTPKYILLCRGRITSLTLVRNICPQWVEKKHITIHYWTTLFFSLFFKWPMLSNDQWCGLPFELKRPLSLEYISCCEGTTEAAGLSFSSTLLNGPSFAHRWIDLSTGSQRRQGSDFSALTATQLPRAHGTRPNIRSASGAETTATQSQKKGAHAPHIHTHAVMPLELLSALSSCNFPSHFFDLSSAKVGKAEHYNNGWNK